MCMYNDNQEDKQQHKQVRFSPLQNKNWHLNGRGDGMD